MEQPAEQTYQQLDSVLVERIKEKVIPGLREFIRIPNLSRMFDTEFSTNGLIEKACQHLIEYAKSLEIEGLQIQMYEAENRTPLVLATLEASIPDSDKTIFLYGHLDKQPHLTGWREGLGPTDPVIENGRLYGRGGGDDGYAGYSALAIMKTLQEVKIPHHRFVLFLETDEESGARDTMFWIDRMAAEIRSPSLVFILDSGALDYDHPYITSSLRGNAALKLIVRTHANGVHSGEGSGIIPDTFRIIRHLLSRIEDPKTGQLIDDLYVTIPPTTYAQLYQLGELVGDSYRADYPFLDGVESVSHSGFEAVRNKGWMPTLTVTGADGLPATGIAGNVSRPLTSLKLSLRFPPTLDAPKAAQRIKEILEADPPYKSHVTCEVMSANSGWRMEDYQPTFSKLVEETGKQVFGEDKPVQYYAMGGSIPLVGKMNAKFPEAQFVVTGVLGPESNAHGPNEMMDLAYHEKVLRFITQMLGRSTEII